MNLSIPGRSLIAAILLSFASTLQLEAQECPCQLSVVNLNSQSQVDNFATNFPGCTEIGANVYIGTLSSEPDNDITDLGGLSHITKICGSLTIKTTDQLNSLSGLNGLKSLGSSLTLSDNRALGSLAGLDNLEVINGSLYISNNPGLTDFIGLGKLESVAGQILIFNNASLTTLNGLLRVNSPSDGRSLRVAGSIEITDNPMLSDCAVLNTCEAIDAGASITIEDNAPGCNSVEEVTSACLTLSASEDAFLKRSVYPNPATDHIRLELDKDVTLDLMNATGQIIRPDIRLERGTHSLSVDDLPAGIYFIRSREGGFGRIAIQ